MVLPDNKLLFASYITRTNEYKTMISTAIKNRRSQFYHENQLKRDAKLERLNSIH